MDAVQLDRMYADMAELGRSQRVGLDRVGDAIVSTVAYNGWIETLIVGGPHDGATFGYHDRRDAQRGHERVISALREWRTP